MKQLKFGLDVNRCTHVSLVERVDGKVKCERCKKIWGKGEWANIEEWGLELDKIPLEVSDEREAEGMGHVV